MDNSLSQNRINDFKRLLAVFNSNVKPAKKQRQTFMSVSGYPHFENVASNILMFLLNDSEEHNLKNLWLNSLLASAGINEESSNAFTEREVPTIKGNRIDILICSDKFVICIENKIYASLYNDLDDYSETAEKYLNSRQRQINIVLSLFENTDCKKYGFINVTYKKLFEEVKNRLSLYTAAADKTWLVFMNDFIETISSLEKGGNTMDKNFAKFYIENINDFQRLSECMDEYKKDIKNQTAKVCELLEVGNCLIGQEYSKFCYNSKTEAYSCICVDVKRKNGTILTFETFFDFNGWHICLFDRANQERGKNEFTAYLNKKGIPFTINDYEPFKVEVELMDADSSLSDVAIKIKEVIKKYINDLI